MSVSDRGWRASDTPTPFLLRAADRLYAECQRAIEEGRLDARNPIADAALDYRDERDACASIRRPNQRFFGNDENRFP